MLAFIWLAICASVYLDEAFSRDWFHESLGLPIYARNCRENILLLSDHSLGLIDENGAVLWSQPSNASSFSTTKNHVLLKNNKLTAHNIESGALSWSVGLDGPIKTVLGAGVFAFAQTETHLFCFNASGNPVWDLEISDDFLAVETAPDGFLFYSGLYRVHLSQGQIIERVEHTFEQKGPLELETGEIAVSGLDVVYSVNGAERWRRIEDLGHVCALAFVKRPINDPTKHLHQAASPVGSPLARWRTRLANHAADLRNAWSALSFKGLLQPAPKESAFGFDQVLVAATKSGNLYGLDTNGTVLWRREIHATHLVSREALVEVWDETGLVQGINAGGEAVQAPKQSEFALSSDADHIYGSQWSYTPGPGYKIVTYALANQAPTANIASVLGNSSVLYKYLNPNAVGVVSQNQDTRTLHVALLDGVTGRVLAAAHHADQAATSTATPVSVVVGEHWLVYAYFSLDDTKSYKFVVWDLYESGNVNTRISTSGERFSALEAPALVPHVISQTYVFNHHVCALAASTTRLGITTKQILAATTAGELWALPRTALNALRPEGKPNPADAEKGILPYEPVISVLPAMGLVSHHRDLGAIHVIATGETNLESTYLIGAASQKGVFFTRHAPSGEFDKLNEATFNKTSLLWTVSILVFVYKWISAKHEQRTLQDKWL